MSEFELDETEEAVPVELEDVEEATDEEDTGGEAEDEDDFVLIIDGESEKKEEAVPQWVQAVRAENREKEKRIKELERKLGEREAKPLTLRPKPTFDDCDLDEEVFSQEIDKWYAEKHQFDLEQSKAKEAEKDQEKRWQEKLSSYEKSRNALTAKDFTQAEWEAFSALSEIQRGIIIGSAKNPALVIYALGKDPEKLEKFANIDDPVAYTFAVAELETKLKIENRRKAPPPEQSIKIDGTGAGSVDNRLEKLREEARRTGDFSKVTKYKSANRAV